MGDIHESSEPEKAAAEDRSDPSPAPSRRIFSASRIADATWRWLSALALALKPLVDVSIPIGLLVFAWSTDHIQHEQEKISDKQRTIAEQQTKLIATQTELMRLQTAISNVSNLPAFSFRIRKSRAPEPLGRDVIVVLNRGSTYNGLEVHGFSFLTVQTGVAKETSGPSGLTIPAPMLGTLAKSTVAEYSGESNEVASIVIPFDADMLSEIRDQTGRMEQEALDSSKYKQFVRVDGPQTVVEIRFKDRLGKYHYLTYRISSTTGGWPEIEPADAMADWMMSRLATGHLSNLSWPDADNESLSFDEIPCCRGLTGKLRQKRIEWLLKLFESKSQCEVFWGNQRSDWRRALDVALKSKLDALASGEWGSPDGAFVVSQSLIGLQQWDTCKYNPPTKR